MASTKEIAHLWFFVVLFAGINGAVYEASMDSFEPYPDSDTSMIDFGTLRIAKKSRNTFVMSGDYELLQNLGNDVKVVYEVFANAQEEPRRTFAGENTFCEFLDMESNVWDEYRKVTNLPPRGTCPLPKGKYFVKNFQLNEKYLPVVAPPGKYLFSAKFVRGGTFLFGYKVMSTLR